MIAILLGAPGVGKGTQAKLAAERNGWTHLSTGDLLRDEVSRGTELGRQADAVMKRGDLVSDDLMVAMVAGRVSRMGPGQVLLLDGFPRSLPQAQALEASAAGASAGVGLALYFTAPDRVLTDRLLGRGRADDTREVIARRLAVYRETTEPLVAFYRGRGVLREIPADRPIEEIQTDLIRNVRELRTDPSSVS
jgi:adenylate kinase